MTPHAVVFGIAPAHGDFPDSFTWRDTRMQWTTPSYADMRLGFEITMYIATR